MVPEIFDQVITISKPKSFADLVILIVTIIALFGYLARDKTWDKPDPYHHLWFERPQLKNGSKRSASKQTRNIAQRMEDLVS